MTADFGGSSKGIGLAVTMVMQPFPHHYDIQLTAGPEGHAVLFTDGAPELSAASPREYGGPGDAWSPEHLLLAAVQSCFLFTLRAVAKASKVDVVRVSSVASGTVDRQDGIVRFTEIVLRPTVTVQSGTSREHAMRIIEKSEQRCLVSASLTTPVRLEPRIVEAMDHAA
jgi:peroxiredoxin-like protein